MSCESSISAATGDLKRTDAAPRQSPDARLLWQCHRGMLELDLILQNFVKQRYHALSSSQLHHFQHLLSQSDPLLLTWLLGHTQPDDADLAALVSLIRATPVAYAAQ